MPTLRSLQVEVTRFDGAYVVEVLLPALRTAGFAGPVALQLTAPGFTHGSPDTAAIMFEGTAAGLDAVLAGRAARSTSDVLHVRGSAGDLRALVRALRPAVPTRRGHSRDVGAEPTAPAPRRKRDRVRTADGRYIKGMVEEAPRDASLASPRPPDVLADSRGAPTDRLGFALQNLGHFLDGNLAHALDAGDDELLIVTATGVERG